MPMKENQPLISVIIAVYNGEKYIAETINSVLAQDYPSIELVVIDDGSTDGTADIVRNFPQVKYFHMPNAGLGAARNNGVRRASGEYLAFIDADDLWLPEKLRVQMQRLLTENSENTMVFSHMGQFICSTLSETEAGKIKLEEHQKVIPGISAITLLLHKNVFEKVGYFFEIKQVGDFIEWYSRAQDLKIETIMLPEVLAKRRIHASNMSRQKQQYSQQQFLPVLKSILERRRQANNNE